jgi:predicted Zn finger-like uncharacterized protein
MESVGTKNSRLGFEAPAPHIVVVCPSCKTSFAVETAAVAALEVPRFHCSRCDDIFVLKDTDFDSRPSSLHSQSLTRPTHSQFNRPTPVTSNAVPQQSLIKPSDFSISPSIAPSPPARQASPARQGVESATDSSTTFAAQLQTQPPPTSRSTTPVEPETRHRESVRSEFSLLSKGFLDNDESNSEPLEPAHGTPCQELEAHVAQQASSPEHVLSPQIEAELSSRKFVLSDPTPQSTVKNSPATIKNSPAPQATTPATEVYRPTPPPKRSEPLQPDVAAITSQGARFSARTQGLITMSTPLLASMIFILVFSYCARISPQSIDSLLQFALPSFTKASSAHLPPSTLSVKDISFTFEKTHSKELVGLVSGSITNSGRKALEGVELEALGFNERGEIIMSSRAPLKSALRNEKISDLPLETVKRYQGALNARDSSIAANETVPFTIALVDSTSSDGEDAGDATLDLSQVKYFSARIFSVR